MSRNRIDMSGQQFGRLTVVSYLGGKSSLWDCTCVCGNRASVPGANLRNGDTKSCGCLKAEYRVSIAAVNGLSSTREYGVWRDMIRRCYSPSRHDYARYGGRGIVVCDRWRQSLLAFNTDMGPRPSAQHSIDRIDNDGNYCPENCRWATLKEQRANRRPVCGLCVDWRGESHNLSEWGRILGFRSRILYSRIRRGWSIEKTLTTPSQQS